MSSSLKNNEQINTIRAAKSAAATLTDTEKSLRAQHAVLMKEHLSIVSAHRSLDELLADMERLVHEAAVKWAADYGLTVVGTINGYTELRGGAGSPFREVVTKPHLPPFGGDRMDFRALCALAPSIIKERLAAVIRGSGADFGLPVAARAAKLSELEQQIAERETQHTELVDAAAEVGLTLPLLDAVQERREKEARAAKREQELERERAAGIYRVSA